MKESPLEILREKIDILKKKSSKILILDSSEGTKYIEEFIYLRQEIAELIEELKKQNIPIDTEFVKLSEIDAEVKRNMKNIYKISRNSELRKMSKNYPMEYWWWHIWDIVEEEKKNRLRRFIILSLIIILMIGVFWFIDSFYKTPTEEIIETVEVSYKLFRDKEFVKAERMLKEKLSKYPNSSELWLALGIVVEKLDKKEAEFAFNRALNLYKSEEEFLISRALEYRKVNDIESSEKDILKVLAINPNNSQALYILGTLYEEKNNIKEAISIYKKIEELGEKADPQILVMSKMRLITLLQKLNLPQSQR